MAGTDCVIGMVGKDFALVAADMNAGRSVMVFQQDLDKIMPIDSHKLLGLAGDPADIVQEPEYLQKNVELYRLRNGVSLSTHAMANYIRGEKAENLRRGMKQVDMLLAGWDEDAGPSLYFLDYLASMQKLDNAAHGYGGFFVNSLLDAHWKKDMTEAEALQLVAQCVKEIQTRFMINQPYYLVKVVDKDGSRVVELPKLS
jgi:20S proteasome subunit beta 4